jgi:hypothetical protein
MAAPDAPARPARLSTAFASNKQPGETNLFVVDWVE